MDNVNHSDKGEKQYDKQPRHLEKNLTFDKNYNVIIIIKSLVVYHVVYSWEGTSTDAIHYHNI
jgi:hypothetical protein